MTVVVTPVEEAVVQSAADKALAVTACAVATQALRLNLNVPLLDALEMVTAPITASVSMVNATATLAILPLTVSWMSVKK